MAGRRRRGGGGGGERGSGNKGYIKENERKKGKIERWGRRRWRNGRVEVGGGAEGKLK